MKRRKRVTNGETRMEREPVRKERRVKKGKEGRKRIE